MERASKRDRSGQRRGKVNAATRMLALALVVSGGTSGAPALADASLPRLPLMPMPQSVAVDEGALRLDGRLAPRIEGCADGLTTGAVARFGSDLIALSGEPRGTGDLRLAIRCLARDPAPLSLEAREGYRLTIDDKGIGIEADGEVGVLRALATLRQLVGRDAQGAMIPAVRIADAPRFAWRGLMVDTARHFFSVPTLKRQIDAMELAKLNVLHLHLSDNEAFRVESKAFPRLVSIASRGQYYTQADIRELVRYAGERGVRIIPEFDLPGHSMALLSAYPELGVAPIDPADPLAKPKSALNPASEKTYRFVDRLLREMTALFPDRQFHIGGDEVSPVAWKDSAEVAALMQREGLASKAAVEAYFHDRVRTMLARRGKTMVGWDEISDSPLPQDVIVHAWRTSNPVSTATAKGNRVIVSAGFYLDHLQPADYHYGIDLFDPMAFSTMSEEALAGARRNPASAAQVSEGLVARRVAPPGPAQQNLVIGGEGALWSETVSDEMLDGRLWPRALALAERFWSAPSLRDSGQMHARLVPATELLRSLGLRDESVRRRMIARLAPDGIDVVARLVGLVAPARFGANHPEAWMGRKPDLVELVDIASTDGSAARGFRNAVNAYLAGDRARGALLRTELAVWVENRAAFEQVAAGRPLLEKAIPTARDIAELGRLGLAALDAIEQDRPMPPEQREVAASLLQKLQAHAAASADFGAIARFRQPPASLMIAVAPDVERLVAATKRDARQ